MPMATDGHSGAVPGREAPKKTGRARRWLMALAGAALLPPLAVLLLAVMADAPRASDVGLIFGTTVHPDGTLSGGLAARMRRGLELYRDGVVRRLGVTGGLGVEGVEEAEAMRDWLLARGVPPGDILVDRGGMNTWKSLRYARERQAAGDWGAILPVSSPTHLARIRVACWRLGVDASGGASSRYWDAAEAGRVFREAAALGWYLVRRGIGP